MKKKCEKIKDAIRDLKIAIDSFEQSIIEDENGKEKHSREYCGLGMKRIQNAISLVGEDKNNKNTCENQQ